MQISITTTFDTETLAGQELLAQFQHLVLPKVVSIPTPLGADLSQQQQPVAATTGLSAENQTKANRQNAAANAHAAANARAAKAAAKPRPVEDLNGAGPDEPEEDIGLVDASSMSPGEARDAGLALVRQAYAGGHVAQVKALQKKWAIAKFYDVPVEKGHVFYQEAVRLAQSVGLSV